jgi:hypothetical protein
MNTIKLGTFEAEEIIAKSVDKEVKNITSFLKGVSNKKYGEMRKLLVNIAVDKIIDLHDQDDSFAFDKHPKAFIEAAIYNSLNSIDQ